MRLQTGNASIVDAPIRQMNGIEMPAVTCATNDQESGNSAQAIERGDAAIGIHGVDETSVSGYSAVGVTAACSPYPDPALF